MALRIILDTHAFAWWLNGDPRISKRALETIEARENLVFLSPVVSWEVAIKTRIGKWPGGEEVLDDVDDLLASGRVSPLPVSTIHARLAGLLPGDHRDPFDRMLAAQSRLDDAPLVTADPVFSTFGTRVFW